MLFLFYKHLLIERRRADGADISFCCLVIVRLSHLFAIWTADY